MLVWGWGHLALGDRRGAILVVLQPLAIGALLLVAVQLIDGTRWLVVFPALAALLVAWLGQAIDAHAQAVERGAQPGGELQVALFLPLAVALLTLYWLVGGRYGSPAATVQAYFEAWVERRPHEAHQLFTRPPGPESMATEWSRHVDVLADRIGQSRATFGPASGLDPSRPFDSLRVRELSAGDGATSADAHFVVEIVRRRQIETTVLGIIPTAGQETVQVEPALFIWLSLEPQAPALDLPFGRLDSQAWRIERVELVSGQP